MTFIYFICFLLITVGVIILLRLNPEKITDDLMRFVSPKQTLREKVQTAKGKKRSRKLTVELNRIRDALEQTGKGGQFSIACAASVVLMIFGCILAIMIDNAFLIPVFAIWRCQSDIYTLCGRYARISPYRSPYQLVGQN